MSGIDMKSKPVLESKCQEKIIEFKHVDVNYKERRSFFKTSEYRALKDVSFDVFKGETLGIIGRNGAGKSTLLRLLAGIIKPDAGEVIHHTRSVSLMALAAGFDPNLSGRQNAVISGMLIGHSKKEVTGWLEDIKAFSELKNFFEKPTKSYSSGMRARLGFAIAMYTLPDVLLIDEVLGVGDASFKKKAEAAITEKINSDMTVILVSHSEHQMKRLCGRIVWIENGVLFKQGKCNKIFSLYNLYNTFSTLKIKIQSFDLNDDYNVEFEEINVKGDYIYFKNIIINSKGLIPDAVKWVSSSTNVMSEPTPTANYEKDYDGLPSAKKARYHNGVIQLNVINKLILTCGTKDIFILELLVMKD